MMTIEKKNQIILLILFAFAAVVYFLGLFVDVAGDAAKYAAIAKNIYQSGDFIHLTIHGDPYDQKPPFLFWLSTLGYYLFGVSNFSFKLFPVLYGFFGVFCVYKLGKSMYGEQVGRIAAILLTFSEIYYLYSVDVHTDVVLLSNMAFALWQLHEYLKRNRALNFILGFAGIGFSMMTKGPIGIFVPAMAVVFYLVFNERFKEIFNPKWLLGGLIAFITAIPAFWGLYNQFGVEGLEFFFWTNNFGRIAGTISGSTNTDYFFYLHTLLYIFAPWGFVLFVAVFFEFKNLIRKQAQPADYFALGGIWLFFAVLSVARGKSPNYILIIMPLMVVMLAKWLNHFFNSPNTTAYRVISTLQVIIVVLMWIALVLFIGYLFPLENDTYWSVVLLGGLLTYYIYRGQKDVRIRFLAPSMLVITLLAFFINVHILPFVFQYQSSIVATRKFNEEASTNAQLYNYDYEQFELFYYGRDEVKLIEDSVELRNACEKSDSWIFCYEDGLNDILNREAELDTVFQFEHRGVYRMGIQFILPASRERSLGKTFLVKTQ